MKIQKWANSYISESALQLIEGKIAEIEKKTTGEIVVLVVKQSVSIHYIKPVMFLFLAIISLFSLNWYLHDLWFTRFENAFFILLDLGVMFLLTLLLEKTALVRRVFLHSKDMEEAFQRRAILEYYDNKLYKTKYNTAVLMMVSILERKAIVLASHELNTEVDKKLWSDCIEKITEGAKNKNLGEGFLNALELILPILVSKFPLSLDPNNPDEISNLVIIKE